MIRKFVENNCRIIFSHPKKYALFILLLTFFFSYFYATLPVETSVESLIVENDPDLAFHEKFTEQFGEDEILVVGFHQSELFAPDFLRFIDNKTKAIEGIEEVKEVVSLANVEDILGSDGDFIIRPLIEDIPASSEEVESIRERAVANSLIYGDLVSEDLDNSLFLIRTRKHPGDQDYDARLVNKVRQALAERPAEFQDLEFHFAGWLVTDVNLSTYMDRDMVRFMPITYILLTGLLWLFLRNRWAVLISVVNITICLVWTLAFLNLVGGAMSPMTSILPPLMMALAVSDSIHIFNLFLKQDRSARALTDVIRDVLDKLAMPCFLTSLTTAIGFASLYASDIPPIRHFGVAAALGMLAEFFLSVSIIPLGIYFLRNSPRLRAASTTRALLGDGLGVLGRGVVSFRVPIVLAGVACLVLSLWGIGKLNVETNLLEYFKKDSPVYQAAEFVDEKLGGVNTLEISFRTDQVNAFLEPANLQTIAQVEAYLQAQPVVSETTSLTDFLKQMNQAFHNENPQYHILPDSRPMVAQYLLLYDGDELENFIDRDYSWARLSARVTEHNSRVLQSYIAELRDFLENEIHAPELEIQVTGKTFLANKLVKTIVDSQVQSLTLAIVLIMVVLLFIFRSVALVLLSIIPNLLPIIFNLGLMGWAGIPLNTATAIISAVAIGIAVDDTIHFLHHYREERLSGVNVGDAALSTIRVKGTPIVSTSLILMVGFGIMTLGSFVPTIQFGFLCSLIMLFAVVCDLVLLPAVLLLKNRISLADNRPI